MINTRNRWWGEYKVNLGSIVKLDFGCLTIWIHRLKREWRVFRKKNSGEIILPEVATNCNQDDIEEDAEVVCYAFESTETILRVIPILADRYIVSKSDRPFYLCPNQKVSIFVGSPLWISIQVGQPGCLLEDIPIIRPSDTWFGINTMSGELSYSSQEYFLLYRKELKFVQHRAVTEVLINNKTKKSLLVEKVNLPIPYLSLFAEIDGQLWTQNLTLNLKEDEKQASVYIWKKPPFEMYETISGPRKKSEKGVFIKTMSSLLSQ